MKNCLMTMAGINVIKKQLIRQKLKKIEKKKNWRKLKETNRRSRKNFYLANISRSGMSAKKLTSEVLTEITRKMSKTARLDF